MFNIDLNFLITLALLYRGTFKATSNILVITISIYFLPILNDANSLHLEVSINYNTIVQTDIRQIRNASVFRSIKQLNHSNLKRQDPVRRGVYEKMLLTLHC